MNKFEWKKALTKGVQTAVSTGIISGGTMAPVVDIDTSDKAVVTSVITVASFILRVFLNWRKHS